MNRESFEGGEEYSSENIWEDVMSDVPDFRQHIDEMEMGESREVVVSKAMDDFLESNGIDLNNIPPVLNRRIYSSSELGGLPSYDSEPVSEQVELDRVIGSLAVNNEHSLLEMMGALYSEDGYGYGGRSVRYLQGDYKKAAEKLLNKMEPLDFVGDGKNYFLLNDGNHRLMFLMTAMGMELAEASSDEERQRLKEKYSIKANVHKTDSLNVPDNSDRVEEDPYDDDDLVW